MTPEKFLKVIKAHSNEPLYVTKLARLAGISPATASKYIAVLEALGEVKRRRIGCMTLVELR